MLSESLFLPEMTFCKGPARMRLEVLLERNGLVFVSKSNCSLNLPESVLSSMSTLSGVVHFYACLKIGGHTDIVSTRVCNTMEYTNIIEFQNYGLPRRSSPQSYYLPEMTSRKSMIGAGFKISFERIGFLVIRKFYCNDEFPRLECFYIG